MDRSRARLFPPPLRRELRRKLIGLLVAPLEGLFGQHTPRVRVPFSLLCDGPDLVDSRFVLSSSDSSNLFRSRCGSLTPYGQRLIYGLETVTRMGSYGRKEGPCHSTSLPEVSCSVRTGNRSPVSAHSTNKRTRRPCQLFSFAGPSTACRAATGTENRTISFCRSAS